MSGNPRPKFIIVRNSSKILEKVCDSLDTYRSWNEFLIKDSKENAIFKKKIERV